MNSADAEVYQKRIEDRIAELSAHSEDTQSARKTVELDQQSVGRLSRMDAIERKAMADATERRRHQEIAQLKNALKRIEGDEFGYCIDCGDHIGTDRLTISMTVTLCISCAKG